MAEIDWDKYEEVKPSKIDWDKYETVSEPDKISQGESLARGMAQGGTLGFADEMSGAAEALWKKANGDPTTFGKLYESFRDQSRENFKKAEDANPKTYLAGEIGTGIATAFIPGVAAAKGAKLAQVAGRAVGIGATAGAGYSKADNALDLGKDIAVGGALGGATAMAAPLLGKLAAKAGEKVKGSAERFAARAIGAERGTIKKIGQDKVQQAGRHALDEGIITPLASTDDMISRNEAVKKSAMNARSAAYEKIDKANASTFNPLEVSSKLEQKVLEGKNRAHLDTQDLIKKLDPEIENILSRGDGNISMQEAQDLVSNLGKKAKFDASRSTEANDLAKTVYHSVREAINDSAEKGSEKINLGKIVKESNKRFATSKDVEKLLENKQAREQGNKLMGLTDWGLVGGSAPLAVMTGGATAPATVAALGAKKVLERYGSQNASLALNKASKVLAKAPELSKSISRNPILSSQLSPESKIKELYPVLKNIADSDSEPTKGPKKWMKEGASIIQKSDSSISESQIDELMKSKKGQDLLIQASDLKPGSKAMDGIMKKIRTGYLNKGDQ